MFGKTIGGYIMYKPSKRALAVCLVATMCASPFGVSNFAEAGQTYDSSNVGIANKVNDYLENGKSEDPVSDLTGGSVTKNQIKEEQAAAAAATEADAEAAASESSQTDASPTDAKVYTQFQDRAVVTAESKANIRTEANGDSEVVGVLDRGGICLVDEIGPEWTKIESGTCVGYIKNEYLVYGDEAGTWCENNGITRRAKVDTATLKVRENKDESSDCVTLLPEGEEYYVYSTSSDGEWTEVSVDDDVRGFVKSEYVTVEFENPRAVSVEEQAEADRIAKEEADKAWLEYLAEQEAKKQAEAAQQQQAQPAQQQAQPAQQQAQPAQQTQQAAQPAAEQPAQQAQPAAEAPAAEAPAAEQPATEAPTEAPAPQPAAPAGSTGIDLANYACSYVGVIPYIWGGASLSSGVDCSGFTMCIYAQYGYSLPHNAAAQSGYGTEVSMSDLQPGDLLFYGNEGGIGHVAIYIGGSQVVHASNSRDGIKISTYNYRTPVKAIRLIGQ